MAGVWLLHGLWDTMRAVWEMPPSQGGEYGIARATASTTKGSVMAYPKVTYLCGGINGLSDSDCRDWRESAKSLLKTDTLDPMRRDYRGKEAENVREIVEGDVKDIRASDFVLANVVRPSWGTAMEVYYAWSIRKPVIGWSGDAGRISPWLRYHCDAIHPALGAAIEDINVRAGH